MSVGNERYNNLEFPINDTERFQYLLTLLHSERPELHRISAILSALGLNHFIMTFLSSIYHMHFNGKIYIILSSRFELVLYIYMNDAISVNVTNEGDNNCDPVTFLLFLF